MTSDAVDRAQAVGRAVAGFRLAASGDDVDPPAWPDRPLEPAGWAALLTACHRERTIGLLAAATAEGPLPATDVQAAEVEAAHTSLMGTVVLLEQILVAASTTLTAAGVAHRVLKGSANAWLDWPDPSLRTFNDVDLLLVAGHDAGLRALEAAGCRRRSVEVHRGFDGRFGKGTTMVAASGHEVDVHRTLAAGAYGLLVKRDELLDGGEQLPIGGRDLVALGRPQRLVHACYHAALGGVRARHATLRDVGELVVGGGPDEHRMALELAVSWGGAAPMAAAIDEAAALLRLPPAHPLVRWARSSRPSPQERRRLRAYQGAGRSFGAQAVEGWRVLPIRDRLAYGSQLLFPSSEHLQQRRLSRGHRWRRAGHVIAQRRRP